MHVRRLSRDYNRILMAADKMLSFHESFSFNIKDVE